MVIYKLLVYRALHLGRGCGLARPVPARSWSSNPPFLDPAPAAQYLTGVVTESQSFRWTGDAHLLRCQVDAL